MAYELPGNFKVDTRRHRSKSKLRAMVRHVLAVAAALFPVMAGFVYFMSIFRLPVEKAPYYKLCLVFVACGMVSLLLYALARADKQRRHEVSKRNREMRHQQRIALLQQEREARKQRQAMMDSPDGVGGVG